MILDEGRQRVVAARGTGGPSRALEVRQEKFKKLLAVLLGAGLEGEGGGEGAGVDDAATTCEH